MIPDSSHWRISENYADIDTMVASDLAWEWLRRNDAYVQDYEAFASSDPDNRPLTDIIRQRWGLRFPSRSG